jgi:hypothetical protein
MPGGKKMPIQETVYGNFKKAYEITSGEVTAVLVAGVGPRILSLTLGGGPNLLFNDEGSDPGAGEFQIYGGHRFWVGPETSLTYAADNSPCETRIEGETLVATAPVEAATGLAKTLAITPAPGGFRVQHILRNTVDFLSPPGAAWALTCVRPTGVCAIPWRSGPELWNVATIKIWSRWADHGSDLGSKQYRPTRDLYQIHPTGEEGKIGSYADAGWVGQWSDDATFVKQVAVQGAAAYPDGGCNIELYTCDRFIEMETLSPMAVLGPGETLAHEERWFVSQPIEMTSQAVASLLAS